MGKTITRLTVGLSVLLATGALSTAQGQDSGRVDLAGLEMGGDRAEAVTAPLKARAEALTDEEAAALGERLDEDPRDLETRLVLLFRELPGPRRARGERSDPRPHGELVLGLIEHHPRAVIAGTAGLMLYPYKRDGMYTGPAWDGAIELWERLAKEHPKDAAIACNAGCFMMADPFRLAMDGERALELLQRARTLEPKGPRWALKLGALHSMRQRMTRDAGQRTREGLQAVEHLRAAWDLTPKTEQTALRVMGDPVSMALAKAYLDADDLSEARHFAHATLDAEDEESPRGAVVFSMNDVLGKVALAEGDLDLASRYLLASATTTGSAVLGSFGPDFDLAHDLLIAGRRAVVLAFLEDCKAFWTSGQDELVAWIATIEAGKNPWAKDD